LNGTLWSNKSGTGSIKERTQTRSEMRAGCQRNVYRKGCA